MCERLRLELELLRRRIFVAKAERVDTAQLELEFAATLAALDRLGGTPPVPSGAPPPPSTAERKPRKPTGRRDLRQLPLEEERVEIADPALRPARRRRQGRAHRLRRELPARVGSVAACAAWSSRA